MNENTGNGEKERKIYILDDDECTPCEEIKEALNEQIASGKVEVLHVTSDEALELLERAGSPDKVEFPSALVHDEEGVKYCQMFHDKDFTLIACGNKIIPLREPEEEPPQPSD
ncbi:MAG: hypothetical protein JRE40_06540 [Deltaproteobacteria bacterium]|nr:hypothetical protein [Deltaproteobacteria bacterium]